MRPATPLPWKVKANARNLTVTGPKDRATGQRPFVDEIPLEAWGDEAKRLRQDLQYAFFAANAYPKLVEILRVIETTRGLEERYGHMLRDVRALLRSLGEE